MFETTRRPAVSLTEGYALCTPGGTILGHTYRDREEDAIASLFTAPQQDPDAWALKQAEGWTAEHVYARIFSPRFYVDVNVEDCGSDASSPTEEVANAS
jgi:hypothetical protein